MNSLFNIAIKNINEKINQFVFFEFSIYTYENNNLVVVGSEDLCYFHQVEIKFENVHTIILNSSFKIDTKKPFLFLIEDDEAFELNKKYRAVTGNNVFKFINEDLEVFYVIAENISIEEKIVKYKTA